MWCEHLIVQPLSPIHITQDFLIIYVLFCSSDLVMFSEEKQVEFVWNPDLLRVKLNNLGLGIESETD